MTRADGVLLAPLKECPQWRPLVSVLRGGHMQPRDLPVEARVRHQVASSGAHDARGLNAVVIARTGEPHVNGDALAFPLATGLLDRFDDSPGSPIVARVPHPKRSLFFLQDPGTPCAIAIGLA